MGDDGAWSQPGELLLNGLLPNETGNVIRRLDAERWSKVEERTAELIDCIQPNRPSEELRNAVANYVRTLIKKCFFCEVFTFGSVPLKTYLPDGDIDLTVFSNSEYTKDTWANAVLKVLENEKEIEKAEFRVKEVKYIHAEVKLIKCLVENIVVDISFSQVGGLCTLCFLEEVDHLINQNHLLKRSIILIKAWCYYESRILGAPYGLISTYALEILVLYIFHIFNNTFAGPFEVLYRFLQFFSNFDWNNFCVSLWGPVPISSIPDITAKFPRNDGGKLLFDEAFLEACSTIYAVSLGGQENQGQRFASKHFNVIDPLRTSNNLGRSVSKGNFYRIRNAFAFGAKKLANLLDCPNENLIAEVNWFFRNTWERHGSGSNRPDALISSICSLEPLINCPNEGPNNSRGITSLKKKSGSNGLQVSHEHQAGEGRASRGYASKLLWQSSSHHSLEGATDSSITSISYHDDFSFTAMSAGLGSDTETLKLQQQEAQDLVNIMESSVNHNLIGHVQPMHLASHLPLPSSPGLASMGYAQGNLTGIVPSIITLIYPSWAYGMQFSGGFGSSKLPYYCTNATQNSNSVEADPVNENSGQTSPEDGENDAWYDHDAGSIGGFETENEGLLNHSDEMQHLTTQISVADTSTPIEPVIVGSSWQNAVDKSGVVPLSFYPAGPLAMLPVYNFPADGANSDGSINLFDEDNGEQNCRSPSHQDLDIVEKYKQSEGHMNHMFSSTTRAAAPECTEVHVTDMLNGDFDSYWQNLQYGRVCQNTPNHGPFVYSPPVMMPPVYLQDRYPLDGLGRRPTANINFLAQVMGYDGPHLVPVTPLQLGPIRSSNVCDRYGNRPPSYCTGTGTNPPKPRACCRDRHSSKRNHRVSYNNDRRDKKYTEGSWIKSSKQSANLSVRMDTAERLHDEKPGDVNPTRRIHDQSHGEDRGGSTHSSPEKPSSPHITNSHLKTIFFLEFASANCFKSIIKIFMLTFLQFCFSKSPISRQIEGFKEIANVKAKNYPILRSLRHLKVKRMVYDEGMLFTIGFSYKNVSLLQSFLILYVLDLQTNLKY
ncbi:hypothetical protein IEQ34_004286 [Dendrobium chrysotoxum]|uniref:Polymerase nucleotidyl transferase domain-containing protein n=1 Tax=Dendrobium chrysotoxum TaxID=161865 RepID=A0AAV7HHR1_DENCH|nr:hypothetical protein IEQ34_004286 [Dendrobium chrysotoxum]